MHFQAAFISGSKALHEALAGKAYFRSVTVMLPLNWPDTCVGHLRGVVSGQGDPPDVHVGLPHPVHGDALWTQQSQGCGRPGDAVYGSHRLFQEPRDLGKELIKQWAKYRYGVFDEIGYAGDAVYPACYASDTTSHGDANGCSDKPIGRAKYVTGSRKLVCRAETRQTAVRVTTIDGFFFTPAGLATR